MRRTATAAVLLVVGLVVGGLGACSDDEGGGSSDPDALPAPAEAERGEQVDVDAFVTALEESFEEGAAARISFEVTGVARLRGRGAVRYDEDRMDVDLRIADWQVDGGWVLLRTMGGSAYMKVPESRGLWVDLGADEGGLADEVLEGADPRDQLDGYRDQVSEVRFSGEEPVAGMPARRYQVVVGDEVTEYWFDADGRVVRRATDLDQGTAVFSWLDWEAPVAIEAPPTEELITLRELERLRRQQEAGTRRD